MCTCEVSHAGIRSFLVHTQQQKKGRHEKDWEMSA